MKIVILDIYPSDSWRLVKDTAGGYGTGNNFGEGFVSSMLNYFVGKMISMPSMQVMYVHSILKKDHSVSYKRLTKDSDLKFLENYDCYIVPSSIIAHETEVLLIKKLQSFNKKIFVIGIFANILKEKYSHKNVFVVPGEPESFFLKNNINNFIENNNEDFSTNKTFSNPMVENLDDLPFPSWDDYVKEYPLKNNFLSFNSKIAIPILATRGCPYSCFNYCTYPLQQGRKVRFRSVENIISEINYWIGKLNTNKFVFRDPVFSINRNFTIELCDAIIKNNIKIDFLIETHLNNMDDQLIQKLKKAGLKLVYVGIESSDVKVLKNLKRFTIDQDAQFEKIQKLKDAGIVVKSMFMLGNPEDDEDTSLSTIAYSKFLPNELVQFSVFTPYPGTPIFSEFENRITASNYEMFNQYNLVYKNNNLSEKKLNQLKAKAYINFYLSFKNIKVVIKSLLSIIK